MPKGAIYYTGKANNLGMSNCSNKLNKDNSPCNKTKVRTKLSMTLAPLARIYQERHRKTIGNKFAFSHYNKARHKKYTISI